MEIFKIVAVGIVTAICVVILKQIKPELCLFVGIAGALVIILMILQSAGVLFKDFSEIIEKTGVTSGVLTCVLKVVGVGYLVEFAGGICTEAGVKIVADKILFAGKVLILIMCLPVFQNLIDIIIKLIP